MSSTPRPGSITWQDLTVPDAEALRDFYAAVVGWEPEALSMGGYSDFVMNAGGRGIAGL
jgi:predicted enzyme related to lactoylglutathione lyase